MCDDDIHVLREFDQPILRIRLIVCNTYVIVLVACWILYALHVVH